MIESGEKLTSISFKDLIIQLKNIKSQSFSGNLVIKVEKYPSWTFSFRLGRFGWVDGGIEPIGCWQRNLNLANLNLPPEKLAEVNNPHKTILDSNILAGLLVEESIDRQQCAELVGRMAIESLFDVIQFSQHSGNRLSYQLTQTGAGNAQLNLVLPLLEIEPILTRSIQIWQEWSNVGLAAYAPSLFALVSTSLDLNQLAGNPDLHHTVLAIDGNRSLRSLAANSRQSVINFTSTLLPLLRSGFINLSSQQKSRISRSTNLDNSSPLSSEFSNQLSTGTSNHLSTGTLDRPIDSRTETLRERLAQPPLAGATPKSGNRQDSLIACIDDSILIYQSLERILTDSGYRCYGVQDPLKIMPSLIRNKPDFIFLDLLMPITNGYEVCEQIRKTPSLKHIPVIILTGKDGLIDRMRSKMVGATGFLGKPVEAESVLKMIDKYLVVGGN
ncbi:response regulator [Chamaesiphon sp. GL140_3_metabinner_50]|uniref:response regulator n=1 Tax=Chamaesiphon sp. GL140_3_metabinner_50 TaxID=2970812 RepID=UPI0025FD32C7|nr:response regulator [Chamaesiphon sp. GL140_3_metabinner_50]